VLTREENQFLLLVAYFPPINFLYEDHFPTTEYSVDYCVGMIFTWNRSDDRLEVATTKSTLGVAAVVPSLNNKEHAQSCNNYLELQHQRLHLELR
jgi:hypothetical protein